MFKALAEYVMRGRIQAIAIALIGSWIPFISQATLGLVTLRRGWREGFLITLWASLPAFIGLWVGQVAAPMALASITVFFVGYLSSCVLRQSVSWPIALVATVALSALAALLIIMSGDNVAQEVLAFFTKLRESPDGSIPEDVQAFMDSWNATSAGGLIACWVGISTIIGLLIARWWQALLYNPGGFQQEFHDLRLPLGFGLLSAVTAASCYFAGEEYLYWSGLLGLPLMFAGLGLAHWLIARYKLGMPALIVLYMALPLIIVSSLVIMFLALLDAVLDLRNKLRIGQSQ